MRQGLALVLILMIGLAAGCLSDQAKRSASLFNPLRHLTGPVGDDVVQLDIAMIEKPLGDPYVNQELWDLADEQAVTFEKKAILDDNGLRVGLIGGMPPAGLQALLTSERSCPNPRRVRLHANNPTTINLSSVQPRCEFDLQQSGRSIAVALDQAQCQFELVPVLSENGKTTLRFTPNIRHGEAVLAPRPLQEPEGTRRWEIQSKQPSEVYEKLAWEVTLSASDYVVVGTRLERGNTLGQRCFLITEGKNPVQHLLVIRTCRSEQSILARDGILRKSPPLALQAGWSTVRGTSP